MDEKLKKILGELYHLTIMTEGVVYNSENNEYDIWDNIPEINEFWEYLEENKEVLKSLEWKKEDLKYSEKNTKRLITKES